MIPVSNLVAYLIGAVALTQPPWVAVAASVAAVLLVGTRERLHRLVSVVPQEELLTAGKFLILVGIILPLVPSEPVTSATPLTPYHVWLAVVAICTLSYISYLLQTYVAARNATLVPAVLGGVYSSTATTVVLAKRQREAGAQRPELAAGIVAATAVMYVRLAIIIALFDARFALALAPAMDRIVLLGAALAAYEWRRCAKQDGERNLAVPAAESAAIADRRDFRRNLRRRIRAHAMDPRRLGQTGVLVLAAIVGITDIDPFVINIAQGGVAGLSLAVLSAAILIAASANNVAKAAYACLRRGCNHHAAPLPCCSRLPSQDLQPPRFICSGLPKISPDGEPHSALSLRRAREQPLIFDNCVASAHLEGEGVPASSRRRHFVRSSARAPHEAIHSAASCKSSVGGQEQRRLRSP